MYSTARRFRLMAVLLLLAASGTAHAAGPPVVELEWDAQITEWILLGPIANPLHMEAGPLREKVPAFYTDHLVEVGGEDAGELDFTAPVAIDDGTLEWSLAHAGEAGRVDLDELVSRDDNVLCYAAAFVDSPSATRAVLSLGSNNGIRAWVNGAEVLDQPWVPTFTADSETAVVQLHEGANVILLKIGEQQGVWEFAARLRPYDPSDQLGREAFRLVYPDADTIILEPKGLPAALPFEAAGIALFGRDQSRPLWQGQWNGEEALPIPFTPSPDYASYSIEIQRDLAPGISDTERITFTMGTPVDYTLFDSGVSEYRIVIYQGASPAERWIADRLSCWLHQISGARVPVVTDAADLDFPALVVGNTRHNAPLLANAGVSATFADDDDSFQWLNAGEHILFLGGRHRGSMYAVYDFLETELGCRWWTADAATIPERETYTFRELTHTESPAMDLRVVDYFGMYDPQIATALRLNGQRFKRSDQPGELKRLWLEHSFDLFVPTAEFYDEHPEYYSLRGGERLRERNQLCLSNPEVLDILTDRFRSFLRNSPEYTNYLVAQNDNQNYCECDACNAIAEREGGQSGLMIWFVNQVAERVEPDFPGVVLGTFAYQYTREAPATIRPRQNLLVTLCSIEVDFSHPFTHPHNESFVRDLNEWTAMTDQVIIWDYIVNYSHYILPHPNFRAMAENFRLLADAKIEGVMAQAQYQSHGGEFAELRAWVAAKLLWDPHQDVDALVEEFLHGYYGDAGAPLMEYYRLLHDSVADDTRATIWNRPDNPYFTRSLIARADELFDAAEARAGGGEILRRVERARMPLLYLMCMQDPATAVREGTVDEFVRIANEQGILRVGEGTMLQHFIAHIEKAAGGGGN